MATLSDIQNSERLLDLSNQLIDSINERKKLLKGISSEEQLYLSTVRQQQKLSQEIAANADKYLGYQIKSKDLAKQIKTGQDNLKKSNLAFASIETKLSQQRTDSLNKMLNLRKETQRQQDIINKLDEKNADLQILKREAERNGNINLAKNIQSRIKENERISNDKEKYIRSLQSEFNKQKDIVKTAREVIRSSREAAEAQEKELAFLNENLRIRKQIEKSTGLLGALAKSVSKIPGIGQYINADEAIDEMEKLASKMEETGKSSTSFSNRLKIGMKGLSVLTKGLIENLKSPEAIFSFFISKALQANEQIVNMGKSLGRDAGAYREKLVGIESLSSNINVTTTNLVEAYENLAKYTGLAYEFTEDQLITQIKLTKQVGLQADEAVGIQRLAVLNGKTSEETYKSFVKGLVTTRNQLKVGINFKAALAEASKISGQLAANLGYNPERIAKAVVTAKALGMTLDQVAKTGESLLNFESSIENELKAELLTGKQLNLERARAAALAGDQAALAEEIAKNIGTAKDFAKMNVLQQKALAESMGMTTDELSETLRKREEAIASGKSLAQITEEEATAALERQTIQDQFNQGIQKLQSLVGNLLAGPLGALLDILVKMVNVVNLILQPFTALASLIKQSTAASLTFLGVLGGIYAIKNRAFLIDKAQVAIAGIKNAFTLKGIAQEGLLATIKSKNFYKTLAEAAMTAFKSVASIPFVGPILGATAAAGAVALGMKLFKADDMVSPGYGKRTILSPEGSIALNDKDTIIAGTNLGGGKGETISPSIDLTPMIAAINQVKASIDRLYTKDTSINMDGKKVGTTLTQGSTKLA